MGIVCAQQDALPGAAWGVFLAGEETPSCPSSSALRPATPARRPATPVAILAVPGLAASLAPLAASGWAPAWMASGGGGPVAGDTGVPAAGAAAGAGLVAVLEGAGDQGAAPLPPALASAVSASWGAAPRASAALRTGDAIVAAGAPLGPLSPAHFAGSALAGVVSGCGGPALGRSLALVDVRCLPGTEGGPVCGPCGGLVGLLGPPLVPALPPAAAAPGGSGGRGSGGGSAPARWLAVDGLPTLVRVTPELVCALEGVGGGGGGGGGGVLGRGVPAAPPALPPPPRPSAASAPAAASLAPAVAAVAASTAAILVPGQSWATGIHVGGGVFLTAAHALPAVEGAVEGAAGGWWHKPPPPIFVLAPCPPGTLRRTPGAPAAPAGGVWLPALRVATAALARAAPGLDVAAVAVERAALPHPAPWPPAPPPPVSPPLPGALVAAIGWPRLHPRVGGGPLVTAGVVSRVLAPGNGAGRAELLTTTAVIHPGGSGGPVVTPAGAVVGLAVANVRHGGHGGACIPYLNLVLGGAPLAQAWAVAARGDLTGGGSGPAARPPPGRAALWALAAPPPPTRPEGREARPEGKEALDALLKRAGLPGLSRL